MITDHHDTGQDSVQHSVQPSVPEPLPSGVLGERYDVVRELGRGGMAIVYLARERQSGREWAVKAIHSRFLGDAEAVARFDREARLVARLQHPGIVSIHSVEQLDGAGLALVMDRVPGRTVKQIIRDGGPMPFDQVERILDDIAAALGYAHAQGVVHRDVKPENIFVNEATGRALLSDFGIARSMHGETSLTLAGVAIGTPTYMSPEQIDSDDVDGRSDLYSLGLVGWEMLTGQRPWNGETLYKVIYRQKHDELPPIENLRPKVPLRLLVAVEGLLEKSPDARWQTADDFRARLESGEPVTRRARVQRSVVSDDTVMIPRSALVALPSSVALSSRPSQRPWKSILRTGPALAAAALLISATLLFARPQPVAWLQHMNAAASVARPAPVRSVQRGPAQRSPSPYPTPPTPSQAAASDGAVTDSTIDALLSDAAAGDTPVPQPTAPVIRTFPPAVVTATQPLTPASATPEPIHIPAQALPPTPPRESATAAVDASAAVARHASTRRFAISAGAAHTCLLSPEGAAYCWGGNNQGQLGTGGTLGAAAPAVVTTAARFARLASGSSDTCAIASTGAAYCWGGNDRGQLGDGTEATHSAPTRVAGGHAFDTIVTGADHSCGLTSEGRAYCWGAGSQGQLGNGSTIDRSTPVAVNSSVSFTDIVSGWNHVCALSDGAAYCWGSNTAGQLGDGTTINHSVPAAIRTNVRFASLSGGSTHTCGITASGSAYCWGRNSYGQLGDGTTTSSLSPVPVAGGDKSVRFVAISAGGVHTCALTSDHEAWCWGRNSYGQLGDGTAADRAQPVAVAGGHNFAAISAFGAHTCATSTTNELFCWGYNLEGQLGDGTREHRTRPVYIEKPAG